MRDGLALSALVEGVLATARPVDELVADDELPAPQIGPQRTRRTGADDAPHPEFPHGPEVRPVRHAVRRQLVPRAVTRQERHARATDVADGDSRRRSAVWGVELDLLDVIEQPVEAGTAEDADLSLQTRPPASPLAAAAGCAAAFA